MGRSRWQCAYLVQQLLRQLLPAELAGLLDGLALDQLGEGRSAGYRRNTAFGAKTDFGDAPVFRLCRSQLLCRFFRPFQLQGELQNISANRVLELRGGVGSFHRTGVAGLLKVIEQLARIHRAIVMRGARDFRRLQ